MSNLRPECKGAEVDWSNFFEFCGRRYSRSVGIGNLNRVAGLTNTATAELRSLVEDRDDNKASVKRVLQGLKCDKRGKYLAIGNFGDFLDYFCLLELVEQKETRALPNDTVKSGVTEMAAKLMMVAVLCAMSCVAAGEDFSLDVYTYIYPASTPQGIVERQYCLWERQKMLMGSRWTSLDCWKCECTTWKKSCERESGTVPTGCMRIFDEDCDELIVRRDNLYLDCDDIITGK
ncbi:hypothetical protein Bbelb_083980 [Branchiostoma belcheri]|nr:hypothetical protein Bbelb_083980 [Branchiostoma belcheri]